MQDYALSFISNEDLFFHTKETVEKYRFAINLAQFNKNLIDPIKLTFDSKVYNKTIREIIESESLRQIDKSNTNHIGYFHQNIFRYLGGSDWVVLARGFDVTNEVKKIYVEMKNKHNTMNSSSSQKTYMRMQAKLIEDSDAMCMLVEVIARNSQNIMWMLRLDGVPVQSEKIRRVSIDQFYALVTGEAQAFKQLCEVLPLVIDDVVSAMITEEETNTVLSELEDIDPDLLKSIYLLSFGKYEGFDHFNV
jgi:hypothetical protein